MRRPGDDEVVSIVLAIEQEIKNPTIGVRGMGFLAKEAARIIRGLRTDLAFTEDEHG
jgi:hypothetical protein